MEFVTKDTHLWRMIAAVSWSILFQFIFLCSYIVLVNFNFWTINIFSAPFQALWSVNCIYILPLGAIIFLQGILFSRDYLKPLKTQFIGKRFLIFINLFSYQNLTAFLIHILLGISIPFIYSFSNEQYSQVSVKCSVDDPALYERNLLCLNENKFFLVLGGVWIGFYTFLKDYILNSRSLVFPPIQQRKFIRVKAAFFSCVKNSMMKAIFPCFLYCILYYIKGNGPRLYFCSIMGLNLSDDLLDTFYLLFKGELMIHLWMFSTIFLTTVDIMCILFNVFLTERTVFPVSAFSLSERNQCLFLHDALSCEKVTIIQHLGFLDLSLLSQYDYQRRAELFTLSQPGGHPHSWNCIVGECFKVIDKFTEELDKCIDVPLVSDSLNIDKFNQNSKKNNNAFHQHSYHNMRNLSARPNQEIDHSPVLTLYESYDRFVQFYHEWFNKKVDAFYKQPIIIYFFGEMSEPKMKHLLCQSQPVIWAVQSLSSLICHSLKEDTYGVAQKDLSKIILSLIHLKNSLDKLQKQSIFIKKSNKLELVDMQIKNSLKFSVKQSLYKIAITFKCYINDLNLQSEDAKNQFLNFIEFMEV